VSRVFHVPSMSGRPGGIIAHAASGGAGHEKARRRRGDRAVYVASRYARIIRTGVGVPRCKFVTRSVPSDIAPGGAVVGQHRPPMDKTNERPNKPPRPVRMTDAQWARLRSQIEVARSRGCDEVRVYWHGSEVHGTGVRIDRTEP
jgi:hypothetical protein